MIEEFQQYDSVQVKTFYNNGQITFRRGIVKDIYITMYGLNVLTVNSNFSKQKFGIVIKEKSNFSLHYPAHRTSGYKGKTEYRHSDLLR